MCSSSAPDWKTLHADAFANVPIVVTGGAGFIGSHLVDALVTLGARVTVFDDFTSGVEKNLNPEARLVRASVMDRDALAMAMLGAKYVFHEAALVSVPASMKDPIRYHDVNVNGTLNVMEAARQANVARVMFAASSSAYGDTEELPKHEGMAP